MADAYLAFAADGTAAGTGSLAAFAPARKDDVDVTMEQLWARCRQLEADCGRRVVGLKVDPHDGRHLLAVALFARCLELYRASLLLVEGAMFTPARIMERCLMEAVFTLLAIVNDQGLYERYALEDELQRRKLINKARLSQSPSLSELKGATGDVLLTEIKRRIDEYEIKPLTTVELAKAAGMHDSYLSAYTVLSAAVHTKVREMQQYALVDPDGIVREGYAEFPKDEPEARLNIAGVLLLNALGGLVRLLRLDVGTLLDDHERFFQTVLDGRVLPNEAG